MTVRIIKPGTPPDRRILDATCRVCTCMFEFTPQDATLIFDQRDGDYYTIVCPTCGAKCTKAAAS